MAIFMIDCYDYKTHSQAKLKYDTSNSSLIFEDGKSAISKILGNQKEFVYGKHISNKKVNKIKNLRIIIGTKCNYKCAYCSQAYVDGEDLVSKLSDVEVFLSRLDEWIDGEPSRIELWGGEPLVYIKHLRKLIPALRSKYPNAQITTITNGSLLTDEIVDFFIENKIVFSISHDSYGQSIRGKDILDNPQTVKVIRRAAELINRKDVPVHSFGFNSVYSKAAYDPIKMKEFFDEKIGIDIPVSGDPVLAVGRAEIENQVVLNDEELSRFADDIATAAVLTPKTSPYTLFRYIDWFLDSLRNKTKLEDIKQKCNVGYSDSLIVDLLGNVYTCQNFVKADDIKGSVYHFDNIDIDDLEGLMDRKSCPTCPFVHMCRGGCPASNGNSFAKTCRVKFAYYAGIFVAAIFKATGLVPFRIDAESAIKLPVVQLVETKEGKFGDIVSINLPQIDFERCAKYLD